MQKPEPPITIEKLRQQVPHKDALFSSALNGVGNALMLATPVFVALDKGENFITNKLKMPVLHANRLPITIGLGAIFGGIGLMQGLSEANRLKQYRNARLQYSEALEERVEALEAQIAKKSWTEKAAEPPSPSESPSR